MAHYYFSCTHSITQKNLLSSFFPSSLNKQQNGNIKNI